MMRMKLPRYAFILLVVSFLPGAVLESCPLPHVGEEVVRSCYTHQDNNESVNEMDIISRANGKLRLSRGPDGNPFPYIVEDDYPLSDYQCSVNQFLRLAQQPPLQQTVGWRGRLPYDATMKPLLHLHIHNEAGSSMCLAALLNGENVVAPSNNCNWVAHDYWAAAGKFNSSISCSDRAEFFRLHNYTFGSIEREFYSSDFCTDMFRYSTVLRNPLKSMQTFLHYERGLIERTLARFFLNKKWDNSSMSYYEAVRELVAAISNAASHSEAFERLQHSKGYQFLDNFKIRIIVGDAFNLPPGEINSTHLMQAVDILSKFNVVKVLEGTWDFTNHDLCWNIRMKNRAHSTRPRQLPPNLIHILSVVNAYDIKLVEHFRRKAFV